MTRPSQFGSNYALAAPVLPGRALSVASPVIVTKLAPSPVYSPMRVSPTPAPAAIGPVSRAAVIASNANYASQAQVNSKYGTVAKPTVGPLTPYGGVNAGMPAAPVGPLTGGMAVTPAAAGMPPQDVQPYYSSPSDPPQQDPSWSNTPLDSQNSLDSWSSGSSAVPSMPLASISNGSMALTAASAASSPAAAPLTLWQRILAFFGFGPKVASAVHGNPTTPQEAVGQLVRRARNGDQNAMAMIAETAKQAKQGNTRAAASVKMLQDYIQRNPVGSTAVQFGSDPNADPIYTDAVRLSHTGLLSNLRIGNMLAHVSSEEQDAFIQGMNGEIILSPRLALANRAGRVVGQARKLQAVRMRISPIAKYNRLVAWELGE